MKCKIAILAKREMRPSSASDDHDRDRLLFKSFYSGRKRDVSDLQTPKIFDSSIIRSYDKGVYDKFTFMN